MPARYPTVIVPVFNRLAGLDACLASLERTLPAGAALLIADDASSDPQVELLARSWCLRGKVDARYVRREHQLGLAANCNAAIGDTDGNDIVVLNSDVVTTPGWLQQLTRSAASEPRIATIAPWSNHADLCSFPSFGEDNPAPDFPEAIAEAAASVAWEQCPELPAAMSSCLYLRRDALSQIGNLDTDTFSAGSALDDFCRRAAAMGWNNVLCPSAFVERRIGNSAADNAQLSVASGIVPSATPARAWASIGDELGRLFARWPDYQEQVARFILCDPLRPLRERLLARIDELARSGPQRDLFA